MGAHCCAHGHHHEPRQDREQAARYRRVLWVVLGINAAMFLAEIVAGLAAGSVSLQADALDFLADAGNYAISLFVLGMALRARATAALIKGASMGLFGLWVLGSTVYNVVHATVPEAHVMGAVGVVALAANIACLVLLTRFRSGDANMRSVWICSRNDVIGNGAVLLAALGVFGTGMGWPDVIVAAIMASLALWGAWQVIGQATGEFRRASAHAPAE